eukprot:UN0629
MKRGQMKSAREGTAAHALYKAKDREICEYLRERKGARNDPDKGGRYGTTPGDVVELVWDLAGNKLWAGNELLRGNSLKVPVEDMTRIIAQHSDGVESDTRLAELLETAASAAQDAMLAFPKANDYDPHLIRTHGYPELARMLRGREVGPSEQSRVARC